jgi:hypothetical protein
MGSRGSATLAVLVASVVAMMAVVAAPLDTAQASGSGNQPPVAYGTASSFGAYQSSYAVRATPANELGSSTVSWPTTWDPDDVRLTYTIYRDGLDTPIYQTSAASSSQTRTPLSFADSGLIPGSQHAYKLVVTDPQGNSTTTHSLINDADGSVQYSREQWSYASGRQYGEYGGDIHYTATVGASATFTFIGNSVEYVTTKDANRGTVEISIDGGAPTEVSTYNATRTANLAVWSQSGLNEGQHRVTITNMSGVAVIDGFRVGLAGSAGSGAGQKLVNDTSAAVSYTGSGWRYHSDRYATHDAADFNGDVHATTVNGDAVSVTFTGTSVALLLETGSAAGEQTFDVTMDGQLWGTITTSAVSGSPLIWIGQQLAYSTAGLPDRPHTLKITKKSGSWLVVDGFIVGSSRSVPGSIVRINPSAANQRVAIPAYWGPNTSEGAAKFSQLTQSSLANDIVVISGRVPGPEVPFSTVYSQTIKKLHDSGKQAIGYVDTGFLGTPPYRGAPESLRQRTRINGPGKGSNSAEAWFAQIKQDIDDWYRLYGSYGLDGIFFDQATQYCEYAPSYAVLRGYITKKYPGAYTIINPGLPVDQCYEDTADTIITFEGTYEAYKLTPTKSWQLSSIHPEKFWHLIHNVPSETAMREAISLSKRRNAGYVYVTNDATTFDAAGNYTNAAWDTIALYWDSELVAASRCDWPAVCDVL